ncbi:MAG TPA: zinc-binding dehydrogenase [Anaerolineae bacterium]
MQAVVKYARGPGNVELREIAEPVPGPGQVKIEVKMAGVCGSDLHIYHDDIQINVVPPVVMGHEFAGVVVELGAGVASFQVGDRVTCETTAESCGRCPHCRSGHYNMCTTRKVLGYAVDGCFARYCLAHERQLHRLPANVDDLAGALTEPLACCVHAVLDLTQIVPGDFVVITGPGPIGLLCLQLAKACGACVVVCGTARDADRLNLARRLGADAALDLSAEELPAWLRPRTDGQGADVFLECSGAPAAVRLGIAATRRRGQYTQIGLPASAFDLDFSQIAYKELRVTGALGQYWPAWTRSLDLVSRGIVDPRCLVSHSLPLAEWREAFHGVEEQRGLKVMLLPGD